MVIIKEQQQQNKKIQQREDWRMGNYVSQTQKSHILHEQIQYSDSI